MYVTAMSGCSRSRTWQFVGLRLCVTDKAKTVPVQAGWSLQAMGFKLDDRFKLVFSEHILEKVPGPGGIFRGHMEMRLGTKVALQPPAFQLVQLCFHLPRVQNQARLSDSV